MWKLICKTLKQMAEVAWFNSSCLLDCLKAFFVKYHIPARQLKDNLPAVFAR